MIEALFEQAERTASGQRVSDAQIAQLFDRWVAAPDDRSGTTALLADPD